jgi:transcriptional regulator with XRE-family HTH domain
MQLTIAIRQRIINLAKIKKYSLKDLASISKIPYPTIAGFMAGNTKTITLTTLANLCFGLNIDLVDFFDDKIFKDTFDENEKKSNKELCKK